MKITPFQGILFGTFGLMALVGLFVFATYTGKNTGNNTIGKVVIWGTLPAVGVEGLLTTAAQTDPTFKEVTYVEKSAVTLTTDLAAAIATGAAPDLVLASQEELHALAKFITPVPSSTLPASTFTASFIQEANLLAAPGGGYYGVPFLVDPLVLFANQNILSSSGIAQPPSTWEALTGLVPTVAELSPTRQVLRGLIALGTYSNVHDARAILSTLFLQQGIALSGYSASGALAANLGSASGSTGQSSGSAVVSFYTQFADPSKVSYTWNSSLPDSQQSFLAGDLALYLGYVSEASFLRSANPNLNFVVAPVPEPGTAPTKAVQGLLYSFFIPRGSANASGAYQVAVALAGAAIQSAAAAATGLAPVSLTALSTPPSDPTASVAYREALYAQGWLSPEPSDTDRVFSGMIGDVISGRSNPVSALGTAENALSALLQRQ